MFDVRGDVLRPPHGTSPADIAVFLLYIQYLMQIYLTKCYQAEHHRMR